MQISGISYDDEITNESQHRGRDSLSYIFFFGTLISNVTQSGSSKVSKHRFDSIRNFNIVKIGINLRDKKCKAFKLIFGDRGYKMMRLSNVNANNENIFGFVCSQFHSERTFRLNCFFFLLLPKLQ